MIARKLSLAALVFAGMFALAAPAFATETIEGNAYINAADAPASLHVAVGAKVCVAANFTEVNPYVGISTDSDSYNGGALKWGSAEGTTPPTGYRPIACFDAVKAGKMNIFISVIRRLDGEEHKAAFEQVEVTVQ